MIKKEEYDNMSDEERIYYSLTKVYDLAVLNNELIGNLKKQIEVIYKAVFEDE